MEISRIELYEAIGQHLFYLRGYLEAADSSYEKRAAEILEPAIEGFKRLLAEKGYM